jgi:hypothetical protein
LQNLLHGAQCLVHGLARKVDDLGSVRDPNLEAEELGWREGASGLRVAENLFHLFLGALDAGRQL